MPSSSSSFQLSATLISIGTLASVTLVRRRSDRTAPYWRHIMVIDLYAALADGVWFYDPKLHRLEQRLPNLPQ